MCVHFYVHIHSAPVGQYVKVLLRNSISEKEHFCSFSSSSLIKIIFARNHTSDTFHLLSHILHTLTAFALSKMKNCTQSCILLSSNSSIMVKVSLTERNHKWKNGYDFQRTALCLIGVIFVRNLLWLALLCVLSLAAEAAAERLRFSVGGASGGPARRGAWCPRQQRLCRGEKQEDWQETGRDFCSKM